MKLTSFRAGLVGTTLAACGLLVAPVAAGATPAATPEVDTRAVSTAEAAVAADYWTPERMRAAIPADVLNADAAASTYSGEVEEGTPVTYDVAGVAAEGAPSGERVESAEGAAAPGIGKVFFVLDGRGYVCSGNSVGARNSSVVATAAHCVHGGGEGASFASRWVFVPSYRDGATPYGQWAATSLSVPEQWSANGDISYDTGFVKVGKVDQRTLAEAVGASPIAFSQSRGLHYTAYGYPVPPPYDGEKVQSCSGTAIPDPYQTQSQGIPCDMKGGSSGGPWFLESGVHNSVNSFGYTTYPDVMFGPYYGAVAQSAYAAAAASNTAG